MTNFARIARPLNDLLRVAMGEGEDEPMVKSGCCRTGESVQDQWTFQCEEAF